MQERPKAVLVVAAFLSAATAIAAIVGVSLLLPGRISDWMWTLNPAAAAVFRKSGWIPAAGLLALAAGLLAAAYGWIRGQRWAWWFAVALFTLNVCGDVLSYFAIADLLRTASGVAVSISLLALAMLPRVRQYFASHEHR